MIDLNRLPNTIPDNFRDADIDEAVSDITSWNKDISPEEERYNGFVLAEKVTTEK